MTSPRPSPTPEDSAVHTCWNGQLAGSYSFTGYTIVWAHGEIDVATTPDLVEELAGAVGSPRCRVIVDLTQVTFMDSTGFNALVHARRTAEAGNGEVRLVGASGMVLKVLRITGLEEIFPVHSTIEESIGPEPAVQHNGTAVHHPAQAEFRG